MYAFALSNDRPSDSDSDEDNDATSFNGLEGNVAWNIIEQPHDPKQRSKNLLIRLFGQDTNIPSVAFYNSGNDPDGKTTGQYRYTWGDSRLGYLGRHETYGCPFDRLWRM